MAKRTKIKVVYEKTGREKALGWTYGRGVVRVDARLKGKKQFEIINHEVLHELFPEATEEEIETKAATLTRTLWAEGYRRTDNHDNDRLQDE